MTKNCIVAVSPGLANEHDHNIRMGNDYATSNKESIVSNRRQAGQMDFLN